MVRLSILSLAPCCALAAPFPDLNSITTRTIGIPYGCHNSTMQSACLSFSTDTPSADNCDVLLNGGCDTGNLYWQVNLGGSSFGMITDLGDVPLESLTSSKTLNYNGVAGSENTFKAIQPVTQGHTYAFVLARAEGRAVFELKVNKAGDAGASVDAAVRLYETHQVTGLSEGFSWDANNTHPGPPVPTPPPAPSMCGQSCTTNADCDQSQPCKHCENMILGQCVTGR